MAADSAQPVLDERGAFAARQDAPLALRPVDAPAAALPEAREAAPAGVVFRLRGAFDQAIAREAARGTGFVAVPVVFGGGAACYFLAEHSPPVMAMAALLLVAFLAWRIAAHAGPARLAAAAVAIFATGMLAGEWETRRAGTMMLGSEIPTRITGRVVRIEDRDNGRQRLTIDVLRTERPELRYAPDRIRATTREVPAGLAPGTGVAGVVYLLPATGPVRPDSYDFSRESYFDRVGSSGFFLSGPFPAAVEGEALLTARAAAWIEQLRNRLADHVRSRIDGPSGEIAAALIAGVRGGIPEWINEALRRTGLAHFLSISGLHMALVGGTVFGGLRVAFALFPGFVSRYPAKKIAAATALIVLVAYLAISGAAIAAQRSFIMFAVMLSAVMFDRSALTMRNLAISAMIVLAIAPHEVLGPSFQMSFAATAALIATYAVWSERRRRRAGRTAWRERPLPVRMLLLAGAFFGGLALTSIIAGSATGIYAAWHFQRAAPLGLVANLAAMPIVTVAVMPMAVLGTLLIPLGLDGPFFAIMGHGLDAVIAISHWLSERSPFDAVGLVPPAALVVLTLALIVATVATTWLRLISLPLALLGAILMSMRVLPDVMISEDGRLVAMRMAHGALAVNRARPSAFTIGNWQHALAAGETARPVEGDPMAGKAAGEGAFVCGAELCTAKHASGAVVAFAETGPAAAAACGIAALIVIDDATASDVCPVASTLVVTTRDTALRGSAAVGLSGPGGAEIEYAIGTGQRPWHAQRQYSRPARGLPPYSRD